MHRDSIYRCVNRIEIIDGKIRIFVIRNLKSDIYCNPGLLFEDKFRFKNYDFIYFFRSFLIKLLLLNNV